MTTVELHAGELKAKAAELRLAARRLQGRVVRAADRAVQGSFLPALVATTPQFMPSGYAPTLVSDLRADTSTSIVRSPGVTIRVYAPTGGPKGRDVYRLEKGQLKHPVFGNRSVWRTTRTKPGFAKAALRSTRVVIVRAIDKEVDEIARELGR